MGLVEVGLEVGRPDVVRAVALEAYAARGTVQRCLELAALDIAVTVRHCRWAGFEEGGGVGDVVGNGVDGR